MATVIREIYFYMSFINHHLEKDSEEDYKPKWLDSLLDTLEELHKIQPASAGLPEDFYERLAGEWKMIL